MISPVTVIVCPKYRFRFSKLPAFAAGMKAVNGWFGYAPPMFMKTRPFFDWLTPSTLPVIAAVSLMCCAASSAVYSLLFVLSEQPESLNAVHAHPHHPDGLSASRLDCGVVETG